jgi:hypothetical protein
MRSIRVAIAGIYKGHGGAGVCRACKCRHKASVQMQTHAGRVAAEVDGTRRRRRLPGVQMQANAVRADADVCRHADGGV